LDPTFKPTIDGLQATAPSLNLMVSSPTFQTLEDEYKLNIKILIITEVSHKESSTRG